MSLELKPVYMMRNFYDLYNHHTYIKNNISTLSFFEFMYPIYFVDVDLKMTVYEDYQFLDEYILKFCSQGIFNYEELKKFIAIPGNNHTLKERVFKLETIGLIYQDNGIYHISEMGKKSIEEGKLIYIKPKEEVEFKSLLQIDALTNKALTYDKKISSKDFDINKKKRNYLEKPRINFKVDTSETYLDFLRDSIKESYETGSLKNVLDSNINDIVNVEFKDLDFALTECIYDSKINKLVGLKYGRYNQIKINWRRISRRKDHLKVYFNEEIKILDGSHCIFRTTKNVFHFDVVEMGKSEIEEYKYYIKLIPIFPKVSNIDQLWDYINKKEKRVYIASNNSTYGTVSGNPIEVDMESNNKIDDIIFEFKFYNNSLSKHECRQYITNNSLFEKKIFGNIDRYSGIINKVTPFKLTENSTIKIEYEKMNKLQENYEYNILLTMIEMKILDKDNKYFFMPLAVDKDDKINNTLYHYYFRLILSCNDDYSDYDKCANYILIKYVYLRIVYIIVNNIIKGNCDEGTKKLIEKYYMNEQYTYIVSRYKLYYIYDYDCYDNFKSLIQKNINEGLSFEEAVNELLKEIKPNIKTKSEILDALVDKSS